jgi:glycosyltransferase involved in cell wall biosynthesis
MKERYIRDGISPKTIEFIPVWVDGVPDPLPPPFTQAVGNKKITFAGNIGISQGLDIFIRAFSTPEVRALDLELHIVGVGSELEKLRNLAKDLSKVVFRGRVDPYEAFRIQRESSAVIAHLIPSPQFEMTLPSKLSVCLAAGNVFLCGINGEANNMFFDCPSVMTFKSGDLDAIVDKILHISRLSEEEIVEMGKANQEIYHNRFSRMGLLKRYLDFCLI